MTPSSIFVRLNFVILMIYKVFFQAVAVLGNKLELAPHRIREEPVVLTPLSG